MSGDTPKGLIEGPGAVTWVSSVVGIMCQQFFKLYDYLDSVGAHTVVAETLDYCIFDWVYLLFTITARGRVCHIRGKSAINICICILHARYLILGVPVLRPWFKYIWARQWAPGACTPAQQAYTVCLGSTNNFFLFSFFMPDLACYQKVWVRAFYCPKMSP